MRLVYLLVLSTLSGFAAAEPYDYALPVCLEATEAFSAVAKASGFRADVLDTPEARAQFLRRFDDDYDEVMKLRGTSSPPLQAVLLASYTRGLQRVPELNPKTAWFSAGSDVGNFCLFQLGQLEATGRFGAVLIRVPPS